MTTSSIDGIVVTPLKRIDHPKGDLFHLLRSDQPQFFPIAEVYCSSVLKSTVKGWKKHHQHKINLIVVAGAVQFLVVDDRIPGQITYDSFVFDPLRNHARLTIPPGIWVAFKGLEDLNILLNAMPELHDPSEQTNIPLDTFPLDSFANG